MREKTPSAARQKFLARLGLFQPVIEMFNQLPGVYFFVKDTHSRLMVGNQALLDRLEVSADGLVGTTDHDYFPAHVAESFIRDDRQVMRTGQPLRDRVAVWYNEQHLLDWFVKNKFPLRNAAGKVVGLMGTIQSYEGMYHAHTPLREVSKVIDHIRKHLHERISITRLAALNGVSPRHLHRRFRRAFGLSAQDFITRTRVQAAEDALIRSNQTILEIALSLGFCDQSAFTRQFREYTGLTPGRFRRRYSLAPAPAQARQGRLVSD